MKQINVSEFFGCGWALVFSQGTNRLDKINTPCRRWRGDCSEPDSGGWKGNENKAKAWRWTENEDRLTEHMLEESSREISVTELHVVLTILAVAWIFEHSSLRFTSPKTQGWNPHEYDSKINESRRRESLSKYTRCVQETIFSGGND